MKFMHTNTLIGILIENKLQYVIWLPKKKKQPPRRKKGSGTKESFPTTLILSVPGKYSIGVLKEVLSLLKQQLV